MSQDRTGEYHRPVMADEVAVLLSPLRDGVVVDATFGGGGHTERLLEELDETVRFLALDRDPAAAANARLLGDRVTFLARNFAHLSQAVDEADARPVAGVLFDFGVSSHQLEAPERGFSYREAGPLDMRMGPDALRTAAEVVNTWSADRLAEAIRRYGEDPHASRIAAAIIAGRPFDDTLTLAEAIAAAVPAAARRKGHPARRTFQALRIVVNDELAAIRTGLDAAIASLAQGGRCVAISYHSLEDRIVKRRFATGAKGCTCPPDLPVCGCGNAVELRLLTRRPLRPSPAEVASNPRARSARLRAAEKLAA